MRNKKLSAMLMSTVLIMSLGSVSNAATLASPAEHFCEFVGGIRHACNHYTHGKIVGRNRYETGALVAHEVGSSRRIILVNGESSMADGLSASALAGRLKASVLPVKANSIPDPCKPALKKAKEVYIVGGTKAVSKNVEKELKGKKIIRIAGKDRCDTSKRVAQYLGNYNKAYLVNGYKGEADAMSIASVAAKEGAPVLLTNGKAASFPKKSGTNYIVIGGRAVMSQTLARDFNAKRIGGKDRYETNRMVINTYSPWSKERYFCNGETLVDALSASYLSRNSGMVLVNSRENHDLLKWTDTVQVGGPDVDIYFPDLSRNKPPTAPEVTVDIPRVANEFGEFKATFRITKESYDKDDEDVRYEWKGRTEDDYYDNGFHTVYIRAIDTRGASSDWTPIKFEVKSHAPSKPEIAATPTRTPDANRNFKTDVIRTKDSTDADNDPIVYEWEGRNESGYYAPGEHTIRCRAVDSTGRSSDWAEITFTITDNPPTTPELKANLTREVTKSGERKFKVDVDMIKPSTDADNDPFEYEWEGKAEDGFYTPGVEQTVRVRAVDATGAASEWGEVKFTVPDNPPTKPELSVTQTREVSKTGERKFKANVVMSKESTDADGDKIEYVWDNKPTDMFFVPNKEHTIRVKAVDATGAESEWGEVKFTIPDTPPPNPVINVDLSKRLIKDKKISGNVTIGNKVEKDSDGDTVEYEIEGIDPEGYYPPNEEQTVRVRATDSTGLTSGWIEKKFTIKNTAPTPPVITRNPGKPMVFEGTSVNVTAGGSVDAEGDKIIYNWRQRPNENNVYPLGKHVIMAQAMDELGARSIPSAIMFWVVDPDNGGGLLLKSATSEILEDGVEYGTIKNYDFNVPPVDGHSGNDYGLVMGRLKGTDKWEQVAKETTSNGVHMHGRLPQYKYDQLKFTYYTNHD